MVLRTRCGDSLKAVSETPHRHHYKLSKYCSPRSLRAAADAFEARAVLLYNSDQVLKIGTLLAISRICKPYAEARKTQVDAYHRVRVDTLRLGRNYTEVVRQQVGVSKAVMRMP